jgi:hypothetical protein
MSRRSLPYADGVEERATPYNRPIPQWETRASTDPTASPIATGGSLLLNANDHAALEKWFHASFKKQFEYKASWFSTDWFPAFFAPMRDRINANFDKAFDTIRELRKVVDDVELKHAAEIKQLRKEFTAQTNKLRKEMMSLQSSISRGEVRTIKQPRGSTVQKTLSIIDEVLHG